MRSPTRELPVTPAERDGWDRWLILLKLPRPPVTVPVTAAWAWGAMLSRSPPDRTAAAIVGRSALVRLDMRLDVRVDVRVEMRVDVRVGLRKPCMGAFVC
ncbi:hypothetical protein [Streptomyces sp. S186]|uniref:hypothetical protein n=1 Tax=Streptomyces sp. S186 TaxID=3434395 RepID=UPI003F676D5F